MKFRSLYKFNQLEYKTNFVFFAQLLEEMLFDYTIDTYKPSILNIHSLIEEAKQTIKEVKKGSIKSPNISHVLYELIHNFKKDIIATEMVNLSKDEIISILENKTLHENYGLIKNILGIMESSLEKGRYKELLESKIYENINKKEESFSLLRSLSRSYITF